VGNDLLGAEESTDAVTWLDHLGRLSLRQAEQLDDDGGRHMVEVDQPAVVELSSQVGTPIRSSRARSTSRAAIALASSRRCRPSWGWSMPPG